MQREDISVSAATPATINVVVPVALVVISQAALFLALAKKRRVHSPMPRSIRLLIAVLGATGPCWWGASAGLPFVAVASFWVVGVVVMYAGMSVPSQW
jgi:hypothetical protein